MSKLKNLTAAEMLAKVSADNPGKRFAISDSGYGLGVWRDELGRFQTIAGMIMGGGWVSLPVEILVNGERTDSYALSDTEIFV